MPTRTTLALLLLLVTPTLSPAQGRGQGRGGGGGGGLPAEAQERIHRLFAHPETITRSVDLTADGYVAETTTSDPDLVETLRTHVQEMSERLGGGRRVRRWDPAFEEFFAHYDEMEHRFEKIDGGIRATVKAGTPEAIEAAQNHARIILDFSSQGDAQMHQPHRTSLDEDGGEAGRFHGGPPDARAAELAPTFGARAEAAAGTLIKTLGGQLKAALEAGGPEAALPVCAAVAIPLTDEVGGSLEDLTIKRVTDRPRNPANAADATDLAALDRFRAGGAELIGHLTTADDGRTVRYYQPLRVGETCLKCHGDRGAMSERLRTLLDERYPDDKANGYAAGDLRGLIRVERRP